MAIIIPLKKVGVETNRKFRISKGHDNFKEHNMKIKMYKNKKKSEMVTRIKDTLNFPDTSFKTERLSV